MNLVQLRIKRTIDTSRYGAMSSGDILRTDAAYARHLVEDLGAAEYAKTATTPAEKQRRKRRTVTTKEQP